jgi:hypothetical protein
MYISKKHLKKCKYENLLKLAAFLKIDLNKYDISNPYKLAQILEKKINSYKPI